MPRWVRHKNWVRSDVASIVMICVKTRVNLDFLFVGTNLCMLEVLRIIFITGDFDTMDPLL